MPTGYGDQFGPRNLFDVLGNRASAISEQMIPFAMEKMRFDTQRLQQDQERSMSMSQLNERVAGTKLDQDRLALDREKFEFDKANPKPAPAGRDTTPNTFDAAILDIIYNGGTQEQLDAITGAYGQVLDMRDQANQPAAKQPMPLPDLAADASRRVSSLTEDYRTRENKFRADNPVTFPRDEEGKTYPDPTTSSGFRESRLEFPEQPPDTNKILQAEYMPRAGQHGQGAIDQFLQMIEPTVPSAARLRGGAAPGAAGGGKARPKQLDQADAFGGGQATGEGDKPLPAAFRSINKMMRDPGSKHYIQDLDQQLQTPEGEQKAQRYFELLLQQYYPQVYDSLIKADQEGAQ